MIHGFRFSAFAPVSSVSGLFAFRFLVVVRFRGFPDMSDFVNALLNDGHLGAVEHRDGWRVGGHLFVAGRIDEDGDFVDHADDSPWRADDYECWMPLPTPPQENPNDCT